MRFITRVALDATPATQKTTPVVVFSERSNVIYNRGEVTYATYRRHYQPVAIYTAIIYRRGFVCSVPGLTVANSSSCARTNIYAAHRVCYYKFILRYLYGTHAIPELFADEQKQKSYCSGRKNIIIFKAFSFGQLNTDCGNAWLSAADFAAAVAVGHTEP